MYSIIGGFPGAVLNRMIITRAGLDGVQQPSDDIVVHAFKSAGLFKSSNQYSLLP
jgi:hypothetical protein